MAKAQKKTANVAMETLAKIAGLLVESAGDADVAAVLEAAGLTVAPKGKAAKGKAEAKAKPAAKGKKKKVTAAQIVEAINEEEEIDLEGVDEDTLREAVIGAKLATKKKAGSLDEEELLELLQEALGQDGDDEDSDDEDEDEDEDDSDDEDSDDEDEDDEDGDDEDEDDEDEDDEDEDEDDEDEDEDEDEDDEDQDLDDLDEKELRALAIEEGVFTKAQAKKKDEDELREALEAHFAGDEDEDEDEDDEDEDFDDEDEDEDDE